MKKLSLLLGIAAMLLVSITSYADTAPATPAVDGEISNFAELLWFSTNYSASTTQDWVLTTDIDASETADWTTSYPSITSFTGTLDGQGYEIQNLTINDDCFIITMTGGNAHVTRLGMVNCHIGATKNISHAGGITGSLLLNAKITKCYFVGGSVYGKTNTGGLVGRNSSGNVTIENCYVSATVKDDEGFNKGNCGGIFGNIAKASTMTNCLFFADTKSTRYPICGPAAPKTTSPGTTTGCYFQAGSFNTDNSVAWSQTSITSDELADQETYANWDFTNVWEMDATAGHPVLRKPEREAVATAPNGWTEGAGGDITNIAELRWLSETETAWDEDWKITADINATQSIDWNSGAGFSPIDTLKGTINGMGHTITGLTINATSNAGFCDVIEGSIIQLGLVNCDIYTTSARGGAFAATMTSGQLSRCYVTGSIKALSHIGGLVGYATGTANIENCYVDATVLKNNDNQALGNTGGLFGTLDEGSTLYSVKNCHFSGKSRAPIVFKGGTTGDVQGVYYDATADIKEAGYANDSALTTTQMADATSFTAWDFTNIWEITGGYPTFQQPEYFTFSITATNGSVAGTIDISYAAGTTLRLKATPESGYIFTNWSIDGASYSTADSINYTMPKQDLAIAANFSVATSLEPVKVDWKIYPNPSNGVVTVQSAEAAMISIIDLSGKVVVASTPLNARGEVSVSSLSQGVYFVKAQFENKSELCKLIVQ